MSIYSYIFCEDCKYRLWVGDVDHGVDPEWFHVGRGELFAFLEQHRNHHLTYDWEGKECMYKRYVAHEEIGEYIPTSRSSNAIVSNRVHKARKNYSCSECGSEITVGSMYRRVFGSADDFDPKGEMFICSKCEENK